MARSKSEFLQTTANISRSPANHPVKHTRDSIDRCTRDLSLSLSRCMTARRCSTHNTHTHNTHITTTPNAHTIRGGAVAILNTHHTTAHSFVCAVRERTSRSYVACAVRVPESSSPDRARESTEPTHTHTHLRTQPPRVSVSTPLRTRLYPVTRNQTGYQNQNCGRVANR